MAMTMNDIMDILLSTSLYYYSSRTYFVVYVY